MKEKKLILTITILLLVTFIIGSMLILFGIVSFSSQVTERSVLEDDVLLVESNQTAVDQFLDSTEIFGTATEKFGIEVKPILVDSDGKKIELESGFFKVNPNTLFDSKGNLLDLGSIHFGFYATTNKPDKIKVLAHYRAELNGETLKENDLYGEGTPTNNVLLLTTGDRKTFAYTFADEPASRFKIGENANILRVFITNVDATIGNTLDTSRRFTTNEEFPVYTFSISFDGDKQVVRDYTGKAVSVFKSDNVLRRCGQAGLYHANQQQLQTGQVTQAFAYPPDIEIYQNGNKIIELKETFIIGTNTDRGIIGTTCQEITGIPRETELLIKIENIAYKIKTDKTQQIHTLQCNLIPSGFSMSTKCSSSFGYSK